MSLSNAKISINNAQAISNAINANPSSISSLSGNPSTFTSNLVANTNSSVGDPIASVLGKSLNKISSLNVLIEKKINDLTSQVDDFSSKNGTVQYVNNKIVISVSEQNAQKGQLEKQKIEGQITSIRNTLNILKDSIGTLHSITSTVNIVRNLLNIQEALLTINPISNATFKVLKQGVKILFLGDMMKSYANLISNQLSQTESQFNSFVSRFMNLQVFLNIQDNSNSGSNITPDEALNNISQLSLNQNYTSSVDNQSNTFVGSNGVSYSIKVEKYGTGQLIGRAYDQNTNQLSIQTAPSYTESPDELLSELKSILNS